MQAAIRVLEGDGLASVSHRVVAAEAGVSVALTTYHFGTLDGLLGASLAEEARAGAARLAHATDLARAGQISLLDAQPTAESAFLTPLLPRASRKEEHCRWPRH